MRTSKAFVTSFSLTAVAALVAGSIALAHGADADSDAPTAAPTSTTTAVALEPTPAPAPTDAPTPPEAPAPTAEPDQPPVAGDAPAPGSTAAGAPTPPAAPQAPFSTPVPEGEPEVPLTPEELAFVERMKSWTVPSIVAPQSVAGQQLASVSDHITHYSVVSGAQSCDAMRESAPVPLDMVQFSYRGGINATDKLTAELVVSDWADGFTGVESIIKNTGLCPTTEGWKLEPWHEMDDSYFLLTNGDDYAAVGLTGHRIFALTVYSHERPVAEARDAAMFAITDIAKGEHNQARF